MMYDWSMESNYSTLLKGRIIDVVCARVGGANTTPYLNSAVHFAKQKTYNSFLLLQNMNSVGENERVQNPARIPPQTPPAGGTGAEAGRIHIPSQMFRPAESIQISSSGFSAKYIRTLSNKYRIIGWRARRRSRPRSRRRPSAKDL